MQYVFFRIRLILLYFVFMRFIHDAVCSVRASLFGAVYCSTVWIGCSLFIHATVAGHLGGPLWTITNSAAMKFFYVFWQILHFSWVFP